MSKFIIYSGREFKSDFTVVSDDGLTPEELDAADTATITISTNGLDPTCVLSDIPMVMIDAANGLFELTLTVEQTTLLKQDLGFKEDKFASLDNYTGYLDFTLVSGNRQATIDISVKEVPVCQII